MSNSRIGVECPASIASAGGGPILAIQLSSGRRLGKGPLVADAGIESFESRVLARGPVFADAECLYRFHGGKQWRIRFRLMANEPAILVSEKSDLEGQSKWEFSLSEGFEPTRATGRPWEARKAPWNLRWCRS